MRRFLKSKVRLLAIVSLILQVGCYSEPEMKPVSESELLSLYSRIESTDIQSPWDSLDLISGISVNTLRFIELNQGQALLPADIEEKLLKLKKMGVSLKLGVISLDEPQVPTAKFVSASTEAWQEAVTARMEILKKSREVYAVEVFGSHDKIKHYCKNECACISKRLLEVLGDQQTMRLIATGYGGLKFRNHLNVNNNSYGYHVATAIKMESGDWGIIDPIMFGDVSPHSLRDWHLNLIETTKLKISMYSN